MMVLIQVALRQFASLKVIKFFWNFERIFIQPWFCSDYLGTTKNSLPFSALRKNRLRPFLVQKMSFLSIFFVWANLLEFASVCAE